MGFLDSGGVPAQSFANSFLKALQAGQQHKLEREKLLLAQQQAVEQAKVQAAQIQNYQAMAAENQAQAAARQRAEQQQTAFQTGYTNLYAPTEQPAPISDEGPNPPQMVPGNPTAEQRMAFTRPFLTPQQAMQADVSFANTEANTASREKINEVRTEALIQRTLDQLASQEQRWRERDDARSQAVADRYENKIAEIEKIYGLNRELQDAKKDKEVDRTDKDQIALSRAQQMATRDLEKEYTHDTLTGQWLSNGVPVKQEVIAQKYRQYMQKYMVGGGKSAPTKTKPDPLGIR